jgi:protein O-GlcNAc transferase
LKKRTGLFERLANLFGGRGRASATHDLELGIALIGQRNYSAAIEALSKVVRNNPSLTDAQSNLGAALMLSGQPIQALEMFDRALSLDPHCWPALVNASRIRVELGRSTEVVDAFQHAGPVAEMPNDALIILSRSFIDTGNFSGAYRLLNSGKNRLDGEPEFWLLYGVSCQFLGRPAEAEAALRFFRSVGPVSEDIEARHGRLLAECGEHGQARIALARQLVTGTSRTETRIAFARAQEVLDDRAASIKIYEDILRVAPDHFEALTNLGNLIKQTGDFAGAESLYRRAMNQGSQSAILHRNLADLLGKTLRTDDAIEEWKNCVSQSSNNPYNFSDLIFALHYSSDIDTSELKETIGMWGQRFGHGDVTMTPPARVGINAPLRVGLLSGSFRQHPVGFLALPGLEKLDRSQFSITCYANQIGGDEYTERFQSLSDRWRPVAHLSDEHLASLIREDRIDILIEMAGHAAGHRLPVVARRVAPVQIKWIGGQFNTMGIETMDYFLSDPVESPPEHDDLYFERIHRLPSVYACYEPPTDAPDVSPLPASANGHLTFGSLNKLNKIGSKTAALWSRCLKAVPDSRLLLQSEPFEDPNNVERAHALFSAQGIDPARITCRGFTPHPELFLSYHDIDIALDPHPYSGCLTTCEALWMGVPVITLPGPTFAGRHSASFLTAVGLSDWIANDEDHFVELAARRCADLPALSDIRQKLRHQMSQSPLCDTALFGRDLGQALREMWNESIAEHEKEAA